MIRTLLVRGMLVGILAGLIVFAFAHWLGEPEIDRAIAFETRLDQARGEPAEPEMVSRKIQKGLGLLTGSIGYGAALGGIFGLVFGFAQGRFAVRQPRTLAVLLAGLGYVAVTIVPTLKYPANPPAVGHEDSIGLRTAAYFLLVALSIAALTVSVQVRRRLVDRFGEWNGTLLAMASYVLMVAILYRIFPSIDEVPEGFPASLLWRFRIASWELQAVLWTSLGLLFGWLTEREYATTRRAAR